VAISGSVARAITIIAPHAAPTVIGIIIVAERLVPRLTAATNNIIY
jgi:hypothetical protein